MRRLAAALLAAIVALAPVCAAAQAPKGGGTVTTPIVTQPAAPATWDAPPTAPPAIVVQTAPPAPQHPVDLSPVTTPITQLLGAVLMAIATAIGAMVMKYLNLQNGASLNQVVDAVMQKAMGAAVAQMRKVNPQGQPWTLNAYNEYVAQVANWAIQHYPDAMKNLGITYDARGQLTPESLEKIESMVASRMGTAQLQAQKDTGSHSPVAAAVAAPPLENQPPAAPITVAAAAATRGAP